MLEVRDARAVVNGHEVLRGVTVRTGDGESVALVGPNGSGKTTLLRAVAGIVRLSSGRVLIDGVDVTSAPVKVRASMGVALVPSENEVFPELTVLENLVAAGSTVREGSELARRVEWALSAFRRLRERSRVKASALSGGERRMLAIAMGLVRSPRVLLFDEPSSGLSPVALREVASVLRSIRGPRMSVLVAEQNLDAALALAERVYVLKGGAVVAEAPSSEREALARAFASSHWVT
ncbi:MAG: ATP-binding cassette domain-containing protein [Thaumarchaeota archaeon]|nr:ATP-binding cassette domain-containing protein [Candidatus Calditenuaceae archaeon]